MWLLLLHVAVVLFGLQSSDATPCALKNVQNGDYYVCVCNSTYCDTVDPVGTLAKGTGVIYVSSKSGKRLERTALTPTTSATNIRLIVDTSNELQTIQGFGGAFTDATGYNLVKMGSDLQDSIMQSYFGTNGIGYTFGRVPMASCDFSTHEYSYDDVSGDYALTNFNLTMEDFVYKIPYLKKAKQLAPSLKLYASPWSSPGWMKTNGEMKGPGTLTGPLDGQTYQTWANYFVRFFEEYNKQGVQFWGLTSQNEPTTGSIPGFKWQTLYFNASMQRDFIKTLLGPALKANPITKNLNLMILDDQRNNLPDWANVVLADKDAAQYVAGIGVHWYEDMWTPNAALWETHIRWPNFWMLATEACAGYRKNNEILGDWFRAELYAHDIIKDLNNYVTGFVDWNLVLDQQGGPNWVGNYVDAAIITDPANQQYFKNPIYYGIGQFSTFLTPGSKVLDNFYFNLPDEILYIPFKNAAGYRGFVMFNQGTKNVTVSVSEVNDNQKWYNVVLENNSIATILFN